MTPTEAATLLRRQAEVIERYQLDVIVPALLLRGDDLPPGAVATSETPWSPSAGSAFESRVLKVVIDDLPVNVVQLRNVVPA